MGVGYIPAAAIVAWLKEVEGESSRGEIERTVRMVRAIDAEFVAHHNEKSSRKKPPDGR